MSLPVAVAQRRDAAVVRPVDELLARPFALALERGQQVVAVEVDLVGHVADLPSLQQFFLDAGVAGGGEQGREHVLVRTDVVDDRAGLDDAGPADHAGHAVAAFPLRVLLAAEHRGAAVGPGECFRAVVGGIHDDGVLFEAQFLELGEHLADVAVVLDHAVGIDAEAGLALGLLLQVREDVHAGGVPPDEERLVGLLGALHEVQRLGGDFLVDRLHALLGQRAGVRDLLADRLGRSCGMTRRAGRTSS